MIDRQSITSQICNILVYNTIKNLTFSFQNRQLNITTLMIKSFEGKFHCGSLSFDNSWYFKYLELWARNFFPVFLLQCQSHNISGIKVIFSTLFKKLEMIKPYIKYMYNQYILPA